MPGGGAAAREAEGLIAKAVKVWARDAESVGGRALAHSAEGGAGRAAGRDVSRDVGRVFDGAHPGPLGTHGAANTFTDGRYFAGELEHDTMLYRAGDAQAVRGESHLGQYWTDTPPESVGAVRRDMAVMETWPSGDTSPLNTGYAVMMPQGTRYYYGEVASQGGRYTGGGMQYHVQQPWNMYPRPRKLYEYPLPP